jgi:hypothetical protein
MYTLRRLQYFEEPIHSFTACDLVPCSESQLIYKNTEKCCFGLADAINYGFNAKAVLSCIQDQLRLNKVSGD